MLLLVLAYLGGVLTIVSRCILPIVPFVLARADQPFLRGGLPLLVGMAAMFTAVATLLRSVVAGRLRPINMAESPRWDSAHSLADADTRWSETRTSVRRVRPLGLRRRAPVS